MSAFRYYFGSFVHRVAFRKNVEFFRGTEIASFGAILVRCCVIQDIPFYVYIGSSPIFQFPDTFG